MPVLEANGVRLHHDVRGEGPWLEEAARGIRGPVCIIAGDADPLHTGAQRLHQSLRGSRFVPLKGVPHDSMNALPAEFNTELLGFLAAVDAQPDRAAT